MTKQLEPFYLTTIPGLEPVAYLELCKRWAQASDFFLTDPYPKVDITKGGLEFQAPFAFGCWLSLHLRIPNHILLRLKTFESASARQFSDGLASVPWTEYLNSSQGYSLKFSSRSSKLSRQDQIKELLDRTLKPLGIKANSQGPVLQVRVFRDQCQLSLDMLGKDTFRRMESRQGSIASLRATTAAGLLHLLIQGLEEPQQLIDPMCGSGTFLTEALSLYQPLSQKLAWQSFPKVKGLHLPEELIDLKNPIARVFGWDLHEKAVTVSRNNLRSFPNKQWQVERADVFKKSQGLNFDSKLARLVVVNPPWGKRLPGSQGDFLKAIIDKYQPHRLGLLMPSHWRIEDLAMEKVRDVAIVNSGVANRFLIWVKPGV